MKKERNLIHIKLDSDEAIKSKRDVLTTEVDLIKIAKAIRNYKELRLKELELKMILYAMIKEFRADLKKLKNTLPTLQIPKLLKKHEEEIHFQEKFTKIQVKKEKVVKIKKEEKPKKQIIPKDDLESQLQEIQSKLNKLG